FIWKTCGPGAGRHRAEQFLPPLLGTSRCAAISLGTFTTTCTWLATLTARSWVASRCFLSSLVCCPADALGRRSGPALWADALGPTLWGRRSGPLWAGFLSRTQATPAAGELCFQPPPCSASIAIHGRSRSMSPQKEFPKPPFPSQSQSLPGSSNATRPGPDYGEDSYRRTHRLTDTHRPDTRA